MRKRNIQIITRLDEDEHERFMKRVKKSGLSQEGYMRHLINGYIPSEKPPPDYFTMVKELHKIGVNLNQIAYKANALGVIDAWECYKAVDMLNRAVVDIVNAVMLPRRM